MTGQDEIASSLAFLRQFTCDGSDSGRARRSIDIVVDALTRLSAEKESLETQLGGALLEISHQEKRAIAAEARLADIAFILGGTDLKVGSIEQLARELKTRDSRPSSALAWATRTFGSIAKLRSERALRFIEEAIELAQADGMDREILDAIANRVYSRHPGTINKEIGQAMLCLGNLRREHRLLGRSRSASRIRACAKHPAGRMGPPARRQGRDWHRYGRAGARQGG